MFLQKLRGQFGNNFPVYIFLIYVIFYSGHAFYNTYNTLFLYEKGLTQDQIGMVSSIFTAILMFAKPLWGVFSDRCKNKARVIGCLLITTAITCLAFYISASAYWLALCVIMYQFFFQPTITLQESYTLELLDRSHWDYGSIRIGGTIGYVVCAALTGILVGNDYGRIYWMMAIVYLISGVMQLFTKPIPGHQKKKQKVNYLKALAHPPLLCIIGFHLLSALGGAFGSYYTIYFRYTLNAPTELLGILTTLSALSEIPFFWYAGRIERKLGTAGFLSLAVVTSAVRMFTLSFITNPYLVPFMQLFNGLATVSNTYCLIKYINDTVPAEVRTTAQMANAIITTFFSTVICAPIVGILDQMVGTPLLMRIGAGISLTSVVLFLLIFPRIVKWTNARNPQPAAEE